ncbi:CrcB protein [Diaminobutyricimonas aerilata]|uniref:Fluoride-specific ion channel FluC n=1 Tax=Diaminobutyricimonas aerilata TaxID=1162967 RepID=A0A2M9CNH6_9MICO|nr:CrcB family protein [Diaminobutyricimonas aerilata]PJJ73463.1 CrcB protein [Diaminobutyricimonas aerilata]
MSVLAVFLGGMIGTALRLGGDALLPHEAHAFPWSTLAINVLGSFVLGMLVTRVWPVAPAWLRAGLGAGVLGSFTTFSAVIVSLLEMEGAGDALGALFYAVASVVLGLAAAAAGLAFGRRPMPGEGRA